MTAKKCSCGCGQAVPSERAKYAPRGSLVYATRQCRMRCKQRRHRARRVVRIRVVLCAACGEMTVPIARAVRAGKLNYHAECRSVVKKIRECARDRALRR